ncbi:MAG: DUF3617 family protein [Povalibacter sp.]
MNRTLLKMTVATAICSPLAVLAADRLNVKTGLWEINSSTQFSGVMPLPKELRDKMTPEQLAKMSADMKAEAAKGPTRDTSRECITDKDLEHPFSSANAKECRQTIVTTTRTSQEVRLVCEGEHKGSGVLKVSTPTPETMNGTIEMKVGEGSDAFVIKGSLNGKWLSADCGDEADSDSADAEEESPADDNEEEEE